MGVIFPTTGDVKILMFIIRADCLSVFALLIYSTCNVGNINVFNMDRDYNNVGGT